MIVIWILRSFLLGLVVGALIVIIWCQKKLELIAAELRKRTLPATLGRNGR